MIQRSVLYALASIGLALAATQPARAQADGRLIQAARDDDQGQVSALLGSGVNVNSTTADGTTALAWAVMHNNADLTALLLKAGANPNLANEHGVGPLYLAIANGAAPLARLLLEHKANPNLSRDSGETPLMSAARLGQVELMKILIEHGADVNACDKKFGQTALMWAAGHPDAVRLLVDKKASLAVTSKTWDVQATMYLPTFRTVGVTGVPWINEGEYLSKRGGQNALLFAVEKRDLESARILVEAGLDVNLPAADGTTPLLAALYKWNVSDRGAIQFAPDPAMANFLLDHGAKVDVADGAGYTPLHGAAVASAAPRAGRRGPPPAPAAPGGATPPRARAATARPPGRGGAGPTVDPEQMLALVQRLFTAGADPNRPTLYPTPGTLGNVRLNPAPPGSSPFHIAANSHNSALVRLMASHGGNPNIVRKDGHTPFSVAVVSNDLEIVKEMVAAGADLKARYNPADLVPDKAEPIARPRKDQTILHLAAAAQAYSVIEYLASQGVPLDVKNADGDTPLTVADNMEIFEERLAYEGTGSGGGRPVPRKTDTTEAIKRVLAGH